MTALAMTTDHQPIVDALLDRINDTVFGAVFPDDGTVAVSVTSGDIGAWGERADLDGDGFSFGFQPTGTMTEVNVVAVASFGSVLLVATDNAYTTGDEWKYSTTRVDVYPRDRYAVQVVGDSAKLSVTDLAGKATTYTMPAAAARVVATAAASA